MRLHQFDCVISTPVGKLGIIIVDNKLAEVRFLLAKARAFCSDNPVIFLIVDQIKQYFYGSKSNFRFPLYLKGTLLQKKIWMAIKKIPYGKTVTYSELARKIGTGPRIIGNACHINPVPIVIPCHRVVAVTGLGGYCDSTKNALKTKKWLLQHENN